MSRGSLTCLADFLAFIGWLGLWVHTRSWPHITIINMLLFVFAWYRLCEGVMLCYSLSVPPWVHDLDMVLRAVIPLAGASYLEWLRRYYTVSFHPPRL